MRIVVDQVIKPSDCNRHLLHILLINDGYTICLKIFKQYFDYLQIVVILMKAIKRVMR